MRIKKKTKFSLMILGALMLVVLCLCCGCKNENSVNIDFSKTETTQEAANPTGTPDASKKPLTIAFASVLSPQETRQSYQTMVNRLSKILGRPVVLLQRKTYKELNMLLESGEADIAFLSTGAYASYRGVEPIELLAMIKTNGTIYYNTYVIVPADSSVKDFKGLQGKVFAFTDPHSYSGRLAVDNYLLDKGLYTRDYFKNYFYTYNHDKSIWAIANHLADGASVDSQIYDYAAEHDPDLVKKVKIIKVIGKAPTGPVVIRKNLPEKKEVENAFFALNRDPESREAMRKVIIDEFVPPQPQLYEPLRRAYDRSFNLTGN